MRTVGNARWRKAASIRSRNFVGAVRAHDLFDKIDIALQIAAITRDFPFRDFRRAGLHQTEASQNLVDRFRLDRDANNAIAFFVSQRNVWRIRRKFARSLNFLGRSSAGDLLNQFCRALRGPQNHFRINTALETIARVARQI